MCTLFGLGRCTHFALLLLFARHTAAAAAECIRWFYCVIPGDPQKVVEINKIKLNP